MAIKIIDYSGRTYDQVVSGRSEVDIHYGLDHPHICRMYDAFETATEMSIVMEVCVIAITTLLTLSLSVLTMLHITVTYT